MRKIVFLFLFFMLLVVTAPVACFAQSPEKAEQEIPNLIEDRPLLPKTNTWPIYFVWLKQTVDAKRAKKAVEIASQIWNRATSKLLFLNTDERGGRPALAFVFTYESEVVKNKNIVVDPARVVGAATLGCPTAECNLLLFIGLTDLDLIKCAVHELGHLIGLQHSESQEDVMYPSLTKSWQPSVNDIQRALQLVKRMN